MTHDQLAKEFAELNGIHWHEEASRDEYELDGVRGLYIIICACGKRLSLPEFKDHIKDNRNMFSTAESVAEVMDKRPDGKLFYAKLMYSGNNVEAIDDDGYIDRDYITVKDKLLTVAVEFCREHPLEVKS